MAEDLLLLVYYYIFYNLFTLHSIAFFKLFWYTDNNKCNVGGWVVC